jgi:hypothetical protein
MAMKLLVGESGVVRLLCELLAAGEAAVELLGSTIGWERHGAGGVDDREYARLR